MKNTYQPFIKCLYPRRIKNPYTGERLVVGCGHCEACLSSRMAVRSLNCQYESLCHRYTMFVTLTYDSYSLPKLKVTCPFPNYVTLEEASEVKRPYISETLRYNWLDWCSLNRKFNLDGYIPYLCKRDLQLFIKRFRFLSKKRYDAEIRYFACGEYGPVHYRPHYHLLLFFDSKQLCENFRQVLHSCWSYGRVDSSLAKNCATYVAGYANSYLSIPSLLRLSEIRPFNCHSFLLGTSYFDYLKKDIYQKTYKEFIEQRVAINGKVTAYRLPYAVVARFFPKCKGFSSKSDSLLRLSYRFYTVGKQLSGCNTPMDIAKWIFCYFYNEFSTDDDPIGWNKQGIEADFMEYFLKEYFTDEKGLYYLNPLDYEQCTRIINSIYTEIRCSYHFLTYCCSDIPLNDGFRINQRVHRIVEVYSEIDKENLYQKYEWLSDPDNINYDKDPDSINNLFCAYAWSPACEMDVEMLYNYSPLYKQKSSEWINRFKESIKHKKLNDANNIFNNL